AAGLDQVAVAEQEGPADPFAVDKGAAGSADVHQDITVAPQDDPGMCFFDSHIAEQGDIDTLCTADAGFGFGKDHFPAGLEALFDADPGFLEQDLGQPDQQANA